MNLRKKQAVDYQEPTVYRRQPEILKKNEPTVIEKRKAGRPKKEENLKNESKKLDSSNFPPKKMNENKPEMAKKRMGRPKKVEILEKSVLEKPENVKKHVRLVKRKLRKPIVQIPPESDESEIEKSEDNSENSEISSSESEDVDDDDEEDDDNEGFVELSKENSKFPPNFPEMQRLWMKIKVEMDGENLEVYKKSILGLVTGRLSCLISVDQIIPILPKSLIPTHSRLYNLLCDASGAYPFKNHCGAELQTRHCLPDFKEIGAQLILECLFRGVVPFDVMTETDVLKDIQTYVRIGMKDLLEDTIESLPKNRKKLKISDFKESLSTRMLS